MSRLRRSTSADNRSNRINEFDGQGEAEAVRSTSEDVPQEGYSTRVNLELNSSVVATDSQLQ